MINPAFIVDGQMERKIIQRVCPSKPIKLLQCNGKTVSYEAAAKRAASLIRLNKNHYPIIIIFDREKRAEKADTVAEKLLAAILKQKIHKVDIFIGIPDRMFENWILADINAVNSYYSIRPLLSQECFENKHGKSQLRSMIGTKYSYSETQDGPEIFSRCDIPTICKNSPSFRQFFDRIKHLNCHWISSANPPIVTN